MQNELDRETEDKTLKTMRKFLIVIGAIFVLVGIARQWPIAGKTYLEFIEGEGYMSLILGLIMIVLGFSLRLLMGHSDEETT